MKIVRKIIILMILVLLMSVNIFADEKDRIYDDDNPFEDIEIRLFEAEEEVEIDENFGEGDSKVVWIYNDENGNPHMPDLRIVFDPSGSIDYKMSLKLKIIYDVYRPTGKDLNNDKTEDVKERVRDIDFFPNTDNNSSNEEWEIIEANHTKEWIVGFNGYFCGGKAILYWQAHEEDDSGGNERLVTEGEYVFYVRGENPELDDIINYVGDDRWYFKSIARHECAGKGQFNPVTATYKKYGPNQQGTKDVHEDYEGCPNYGAPDGWGVMQLESGARNHYTNMLVDGENGQRDRQLLWNWQNNVDAGITWSEKLRTAEDVTHNESAINWFKRQIAHAMYYNNSIDNIGILNTIYYPDENSENRVELDEPYWFFKQGQWNLDYMRYVGKKEEDEGEEEEEDVYIITTPLEKVEESIGHLHIVEDGLPLPPELTGDEYNTIDRLFRNYIVISDYAMTEDGGIDHNDNKTLFDALAIRLYNGGFFLAYKYDRDDPDNQYGYWEYREYWDKNGNGQPDEGEQYYVREVCTEYVNYFGGVGN